MYRKGWSKLEFKELRERQSTFTDAIFLRDLSLGDLLAPRFRAELPTSSLPEHFKAQPLYLWMLSMSTPDVRSLVHRWKVRRQDTSVQHLGGIRTSGDRACWKLLSGPDVLGSDGTESYYRS